MITFQKNDLKMSPFPQNAVVFRNTKWFSQTLTCFQRTSVRLTVFPLKVARVLGSVVVKHEDAEKIRGDY